jgi:hypothetical protein
MATGHIQVADMITPQVFTGMAIERTREKTEFLRSGILRDSGVLNAWLTSTIGNGGGGQTLRRPTWNDLDASDATGIERISSDAASPLYTAGFGTAFPAPQELGTHEEIAVFVDRNQHWSALQMAGIISGAKGNMDPISVVGDLVGNYWARRLQKMTLATVAGVLADNDAAPSGTEHVAGDLTVNVSGGGFVNGMTNFTAEALYDALQTLGDADNVITNLAVHSAVRNRMRKNNLIDDVRDSDGNFQFEAFQNLRLTVDDGLPNPSAGIFHSYLFGPGFLEYGAVAPENATTTVWRDEAGNGSGSKELWNRVRWSVHPMGHKYVAASIPAFGGPANGDAATVNTLAHAASWQRSAQSRKHIPFARLITRES